MSSPTQTVEVPTRTRVINLVAVFAPFVATGVAVALAWGSLVSWLDLALLATFYVISILGITVGYHRLLTHRSFDTYPWLRDAFAVAGCTAVQGPPIIWVADHRQHHTFADEDGDPHSPHTHAHDGPFGALRGLGHAHVGWLLKPDRSSQPLRYARDLLRDPFMRALNRWYLAIVLAGLLVPAVIGGLVTMSLAGAATGLLWGGLVRVFFGHHMTWSVNSLGHYAGRRRFATNDRSTNVAWLAIASFGDSWHHNHHAFPQSAKHGLQWWEFDPGGIMINVLERLGLAWNVVRKTDAEISGKEVAAGSRH